MNKNENKKDDIESNVAPLVRARSYTATACTSIRCTKVIQSWLSSNASSYVLKTPKHQNEQLPIVIRKQGNNAGLNGEN